MTYKILEKQVENLTKEVQKLRSFVFFRISEDDSVYNPGFIKRVLSSVKRKPSFKFKKPGDFLQQVRKA